MCEKDKRIADLEAALRSVIPRCIPLTSADDSDVVTVRVSRMALVNAIYLLRCGHDAVQWKQRRMKSTTKENLVMLRDAVRRRESVSVCRDCAIAAGATWPDGHLATHFIGTCRGCGLETETCSTTDWDWPNNRGGRLMKQRREI